MTLLRGSIYNSDMTNGTAAKLAKSPRPEITIETLRNGLAPAARKNLASIEAQIVELGMVAGTLRDLLNQLGTNETSVDDTAPRTTAKPKTTPVYSNNAESNTFRTAAVEYLRANGPAKASSVGHVCNIKVNGATIRLQGMRDAGLVRQNKTTKLWSLAAGV